MRVRFTRCWWNCLILAFPVVMAAGCANSSVTSPVSEDIASAEGFLARFPPLPESSLSERDPSETSVDTLKGSNIWSASGGATVEGDTLVLPSGPGELQWAIYRFPIPLVETSTYQLEATLVASGGAGGWIGVSDYIAGAWAFHGPYPGDALIPVDYGIFLSEIGNFYAAVIAHDGATVTVNSVSLAYDNGVRQP